MYQTSYFKQIKSMKLTKDQLNQLNRDITNLSDVLNSLDTIAPNRLIVALSTTCDNLLHILKEIETSLDQVEPIDSIEPNYLTYDEFMRQVLDNDIIIVTDWYAFVRMNSLTDETNLDFYQRKIEYINNKIVPKL